jgi:N-methylhydantoinase A/oxoprolinase/acetone carboxylase beta subunit
MVDNGICIGGWRTQVKGVFMDTFALGGDSVIRIQDGKLELCTRRVLPLCVAATKWPGIKHTLRQLLKENKTDSLPLHEFLYLVREPKDVSRYNSHEIALCDALRAGPCMLGNAAKSIGIDLYTLNSERLESEGIVMRCGLTPTDIMHVKGDFTLFDKESSVLAARYFLKCLPDYNDNTDSLNAFTDKVYDLIKQKLYNNIVRVLLTDKYPKLREKGLNEQMCFLISQGWTQRKGCGNKSFFDFDFTTVASLIGIGAPTHVFLPDVAKALGTNCIIPEHAEVANAVGAVIADISAKARVEISPNYTPGGILGYTVHTPNGNQVYDTLEEASCTATEAAIQSATEEARRRGALGELSVDTQLSPKIAYAREGQAIDLGTSAIARVTGRIEM